MIYLLDTHAFVWLDGNDASLSAVAKQIIADRNNQIYLSTASIWEIQIKHQIGKLQLRLSIQDIVAEQQAKNQIHILPIMAHHVYELQQLPSLHGDPFDRILIAQARSEKFDLITRDPKITDYPVTVIW